MSLTPAVALKRESLWVDRADDAGFPVLDRPLSVDVAILGGGIVGISTALLLKRAGMTVAVVEAERVGTGVTGHTTAKLSALHGLTYQQITPAVGEDGARAYAAANQAGIERIARWVEEEAIDCDFRRKPNYTYVTSRERLGDIEKEVEAAQRAGLAAVYTDETDLPYPIAGAIRLDDQAEFHPRRFVLALAKLIPGDGSYVCEHTRATGVSEGKPCKVQTTSAPLTAGRVVVATHFPFLDRGLYFARMHPERSYALGVRVRGAGPQGMYISGEQPTRSIRTHPTADGEILIVGGEGHKTGQGGDTLERYRALEQFARAHWDVEAVEYQWASQDNETVDKVPYVGSFAPQSHRIYTATGFKKWGLAQGVGAAMILEDLILGRQNEWASVYDPNRVKPLARPSSVLSFTKENANVAGRFVGDRVTKRGGRDAAELQPGEGDIAQLDGEKVAAFRDDDGVLHAVSPVCTHLGCQVNWNSGDRSWDCPCHGSRFSPDGEILHGPAVRPLERRK
ncbi:MAG TPA: FAD-dependent oxidoreductase [Thermoleophilaceae bacterium]|nr:FAD-dependent oxidoreductase [Thermoleophilaceae bacterium]